MAFLRQRKKKNGVSWNAVFKENGKQYSISLDATTKHKAQEELAGLIVERKKSFYGLHIKQRSIEDLSKEWVETRKLELKRNTIDFLENRLKCGILPYFGNRMADSIKPLDVERYKVNRSKAVAAGTLNHELCVLSGVLEFARRMGNCRANAVKEVDKLRQERKRFPALTIEEAHDLIDATEPGQPRTLITFLLGTGARIGEALGAKWRNLDWSKKELAIVEAYDGHQLQTPKTASSIRTLSLPNSIIASLKEHRREQLEERMKKGGAWNNLDLIFCSPDGSLLHRDSVRHHVFYPALKASKIGKNIRLHDLRGTFVTLSLESGANVRAIQGAVGHSTSRMTMEVYGRVNEASRQEAAQKLQTHLFELQPQQSILL